MTGRAYTLMVVDDDTLLRSASILDDLAADKKQRAGKGGAWLELFGGRVFDNAKLAGHRAQQGDAPDVVLLDNFFKKPGSPRAVQESLEFMLTLRRAFMARGQTLPLCILHTTGISPL